MALAQSGDIEQQQLGKKRWRVVSTPCEDTKVDWNILQTTPTTSWEKTSSRSPDLPPRGWLLNIACIHDLRIIVCYKVPTTYAPPTSNHPILVFSFLASSIRLGTPDGILGHSFPSPWKERCSWWHRSGQRLNRFASHTTSVPRSRNARGPMCQFFLRNIHISSNHHTRSHYHHGHHMSSPSCTSESESGSGERFEHCTHGQLAEIAGDLHQVSLGSPSVHPRTLTSTAGLSNGKTTKLSVCCHAVMKGMEIPRAKSI